MLVSLAGRRCRCISIPWRESAFSMIDNARRGCRTIVQEILVYLDLDEWNDKAEKHTRMIKARLTKRITWEGNRRVCRSGDVSIDNSGGIPVDGRWMSHDDASEQNRLIPVDSFRLRERPWRQEPAIYFQGEDKRTFEENVASIYRPSKTMDAMHGNTSVFIFFDNIQPFLTNHRIRCTPVRILEVLDKQSVRLLIGIRHTEESAMTRTWTLIPAASMGLGS